jgi:NAD(P)-dependent dehydrogenase (short-subunit alcohol dehydrogenase family)
VSPLPLFGRPAHGRSTPLLQDWLGDDAAKRHRREIHFPTGRFGEAIEQAQAILFLASDESSFVNGTDFVVDGGMTKVRGGAGKERVSG